MARSQPSKFLGVASKGTKGTTCHTVLKNEHVWCVGGRERRPEWLDYSEQRAK